MILIGIVSMAINITCLSSAQHQKNLSTIVDNELLSSCQPSCMSTPFIRNICQLWVHFCSVHCMSVWASLYIARWWVASVTSPQSCYIQYCSKQVLNSIHLAKVKQVRSDDVGGFISPWQITLEPGWALPHSTLALSCVAAHPEFWCLSCKHSWVRARDSMGQISTHTTHLPSYFLANLWLHITQQTSVTVCKEIICSDNQILNFLKVYTSGFSAYSTDLLEYWYWSCSLM